MWQRSSCIVLGALGSCLFALACNGAITGDDGHNGENGSDGADMGASAATDRIAVPIEVYPTKIDLFDSTEHCVARTFRVDDPSKAERLLLQGHNLHYRDGHLVDGTLVKDGKASVILNGGTRVSLTNETVDLYRAERVWGGIGGGYRTIRGTIALEQLGGLRSGENTIQFCFNGTDGASSGFRILRFNFTGANDYTLFAASDFVEDDPDTWRAPAGADAARGRQLWEGSFSLIERPGGSTIRASCADCHDASGRDLQYFAYSNLSIISRAVFHGLTLQDGDDIAAYIRENPAPRYGRPWNPPYQPAPGIDSRADAAARWAAGAGLDAVLESERQDALDQLFPRASGSDGRRTVADILSVLRADDLPQRTINLRETSVALQLPDWNSWLPEVHPRDLWGPLFMEGEQGDCGTVPSPHLAYEQAMAGLATATTPSQYRALTPRIERATRAFIGVGPKPGTDGSDWRRIVDNAEACAPVRRIQRGVSAELAKRSLAQWLAVKQWEMVQRFELEDQAAAIYAGTPRAEFAEALSWPLDGQQSVHPVAPHIVSDDLQLFRSDDVKQTAVKSKYDSTAWYQLNMILDTGARHRTGVAPVDWPYQYRHIFEAADYAQKQAENAFDAIDYQPLRQVHSMIKAYQMRDNGGFPDVQGWTLRYVSPFWLVYHPDQMAALDALEPELERKVVEAFVLRYVEIASKINDGAWSVCPANPSTPRTWFCIQGKDYKPVPAPPQTAPRNGRRVPRFSIGHFNHADDFLRLFPILRAKGVSQEARDKLRSWCKQRWPLGDWGNAEAYP